MSKMSVDLSIVVPAYNEEQRLGASITAMLRYVSENNINGELIVVETVFNAPGLGLDAWHLARTRDLEGLATTIGWLTRFTRSPPRRFAPWLRRRIHSRHHVPDRRARRARPSSRARPRHSPRAGW